MTAEDRSEARFFKTPEAFRKWLERNHDKKPEPWVGADRRLGLGRHLKHVA